MKSGFWNLSQPGLNVTVAFYLLLSFEKLLLAQLHRPAFKGLSKAGALAARRAFAVPSSCSRFKRPAIP